MARIAIVYDSLFPINNGGGERVYRRMSELLLHAGHSVDYLTRRQWEVAPETPFRLVPVWTGEIYDAEGTRTTRSALQFARGVHRALRDDRGYDIVIASALPVLTLLAARLAVNRRRTYLVADWLEVWGAGKWRSYAGVASGTIAWALQWLGLRSADLHTVNSHFTAGRVMKYSKSAAPLVLGLLDTVAGPGTVSEATSPQYALFVGRLIPDKRAAVLPAAVATVPGLGLRIVGSGPEETAVLQAITDAGVGELLGRVSDARLAELMSGAAVLVNPSAREGFGLVVAEAAAHGVPSVVVAGEDNAAVELVVPGVNGLVAASVDSAVLGAAIAGVVSAGMRESTAQWFAEGRATAGLAASMDDLLRRYSAWLTVRRR